MDEKQVTGVLRLFFNTAVVKYGNKLTELLGEEGYVRYQEETASGNSLVGAFGLKTPDHIFGFMKEVNGIPWEREGDAFITKSCPAMAAGQRMGLAPTCRGCCLAPMKAMVEAADPALTVNMEASLWIDGQPCIFRVVDRKSTCF